MLSDLSSETAAVTWAGFCVEAGLLVAGLFVLGIAEG